MPPRAGTWAIRDRALLHACTARTSHAASVSTGRASARWRHAERKSAARHAADRQSVLSARPAVPLLSARSAVHLSCPPGQLCTSCLPNQVWRVSTNSCEPGCQKSEILIGGKCCPQSAGVVVPGCSNSNYPTGQTAITPSNFCCKNSQIYTNASGGQACCIGKIVGGKCVPVIPLPKCAPRLDRSQMLPARLCIDGKILLPQESSSPRPASAAPMAKCLAAPTRANACRRSASRADRYALRRPSAGRQRRLLQGREPDDDRRLLQCRRRPRGIGSHARSCATSRNAHRATRRYRTGPVATIVTSAATGRPATSPRGRSRSFQSRPCRAPRAKSATATVSAWQIPERPSEGRRAQPRRCLRDNSGAALPEGRRAQPCRRVRNNPGAALSGRRRAQPRRCVREDLRAALPARRGAQSFRCVRGDPAEAMPARRGAQPRRRLRADRASDQKYTPLRGTAAAPIDADRKKE